MTSEPDKPKRRGRWLQYSLRTFFVLLTVFCVWLGVVVHRANEQRKAVAWVREMGGYAWYDYQFDERGLFILDAEPPVPKWLVQPLGADYFQEVYWVSLDNTQVNDLTPLAGLKKLKWLHLYRTQVCDLTPLAKLTSLELLYLDSTQVSELTPLAGLTNLKQLTLESTQVGDLTPLAGLKNLELVDLEGTQVSDLTPLAGLKKLQAVLLDNTPVSEEQVEELRKALPRCDIPWSPPDPSP